MVRTILIVRTLFFGIAILIGQAPGAMAVVDDSDLAGTRNARLADNAADIPIALSPDQIQTESTPGPTVLEILREVHGKLTPVSGLPLRVQSGDGVSEVYSDELGQASMGEWVAGPYRLEIPLKAEQFEVTNGSETYKIVADVSHQGRVKLIFREDSSGGQALGIWQVAHRAKTKLQTEVGLAFWSNPIEFIWPAEGDYYQFGQVHITRGQQWDVIGHEMGHAIYDLGAIGRFGGGPHKIDECYGEDLAFSEGWASYFSAWVSLDLSDPDAKFEYMVPRRAPIRIETIPSDVCHGETNEWRVTGFFWDLIDRHDDGENSQDPFARIWNALKGTRVGSATLARKRLESSGFDPAILQQVWDLNFQK